jgi:hypothetical protein
MISYYDTPNYCVAFNPKTGCTSFAKAIILSFYPDIYNQIKDSFDEYKYGQGYIVRCPILQNPEKPIVCLVRNPIDRFCSAVNQTKISLEEAIDSLMHDKKCNFPNFSKPQQIRKNIHFIEQNKWLKQTCHLFKFPDHIDSMSEFIGIKGQMPHLNQSNKKIFLTKDQFDFIHFYYYDDIKLFEQIKEPNTIVKV